MNNKRTIWIIGGVVGAILLCLCVVGIGIAVAGGSIFNQAKETASQIATVEPAVEVPTSAPEIKQPASPTGEATPELAAEVFLKYLADQQYAEAVAMMTADLRGDSSTSGALQEIVETKALKPYSWEWTNQSENSDGSEVYFEGTMTYANQTTGPVQIQVRKEDGVWRVFYMDVKSGTGDQSSGMNTWNSLSETQQNEQVNLARGSADAFMTLWQSGQYPVAYEMTTKEMKGLVGTADDLANILEGIGAKPESWEWSATDFIDIGSEYPVIDFQGTAIYPGGQKGPVQIQVELENGAWLVRYINVQSE